MAGKFELKSSPGGKFMFNLKAGNNQVILTSELYNDRSGAKKGIESVKRHASRDHNYVRRGSSSGELYFVLKAVNGEIIGTSEMYSSSVSMENGIVSVKTNAPGALLADLAM